MKIRFRIVIFITVLIAINGGCTPQANTLPNIALELISSGFTSPVAIAAPNDESRRLFVADQTGTIWIISEGQKQETPFLDLSEKLVELSSFYDERGLLGLAFHPDFAVNGRFYVSYSGLLRAGLSPADWDHTTYISEFSVSENNPNQADPNSERVLLAIDKPGYNYEAGNLAFGPDGYLYISTGDSVRDPSTEAGKFAQDTFSLLGKILRVDVSAAEGYLIPADNPFAKGRGAPEVFAYGFRNPYRFSFDDSGRLFVADVGQARMEEVNLVEPGRNYGWPIREGTTCFNAGNWNEPLESCSANRLVEPILSYAHEGDLSAVIGGGVYGGEAVPALDGAYLFGDWGQGRGHLFAAFPPNFGGSWTFRELQISGDELGQLLGMGQDANGEFYLLTKAPGMGPTGNSGVVYKIVPAGGNQ